MSKPYTICYFSKSDPSLTDSDIKDILDFTDTTNNAKGVGGILLHSFGNFFQVLEGDEKYLTDLYEHNIKKDARHHSIFEVIHKKSNGAVFAGYSSRFHSVDSRKQLNEIKAYLNANSAKSTTTDKISRMLKSFVILD